MQRLAALPCVYNLVSTTSSFPVRLSLLLLLSFVLRVFDPQITLSRMVSHTTPNEKPLESLGVDEETEALEGYVVDPGHYANNAARLKTSSDGRFVLIPQPLDSPNDPLNWPEGKKRWIVAVIAFIALLADYTGGTAIITVLPQSM